MKKSILVLSLALVSAVGMCLSQAICSQGSPDITGDEYVNSQDLLEVIEFWHTVVPPAPTATPTQIPEAVTYNDIKPILDQKCVGCHITPLAPLHDLLKNVVGACERCHSENKGVSDKGWPDLTTEALVEEAVNRGTFRQWIQPGGLMGAAPPIIPGATWPPHLTEQEVGQLTAYADSISDEGPLGYDPFLIAAPVTVPPVVDGDGSDAAWNEATEHLIGTQPTYYTNVSQIATKAVYTQTDLYIRVEYQDSTLSMTRSGAWLWNGASWIHPPASTEDDKQSEDRVSIMWNKTIPNFRERHGCAYKCHGNVAGRAESFTDLENERADKWHSKAARGLGLIGVSQLDPLTVAPVSHEVTAGQVTMNGYLDDKHVVWLNGPGYGNTDGGRRPDAGTSAYSNNRNGAQTAPKVLEATPTNYADAMNLTQAEIDAGETIVADPGDPAYAGNVAVSAAWAIYDSFAAVVPEQILRMPAGSRADVRMSATWSGTGGGMWVVEIQRALDSGHPEDDVIFNDLSGHYQFGIAVFDNCGRGEVPPGHTTYGECQYQVLRFER